MDIVLDIVKNDSELVTYINKKYNDTNVCLKVDSVSSFLSLIGYSDYMFLIKNNAFNWPDTMTYRQKIKFLTKVDSLRAIDSTVLNYHGSKKDKECAYNFIVSYDSFDNFIIIRVLSKYEKHQYKALFYTFVFDRLKIKFQKKIKSIIMFNPKILTK
jgi:hypothetical protein